MFMRVLAAGMLVLSLTRGPIFAASDGIKGHQGHGAHTESPVLPEGRYSAKVKALVCEGCKPFVEKAMLGVPGVESATVDSKASRVNFDVKKGANVKWSALQEALQTSANKMGMGADYTLSDFKMVSIKNGGPHASAQTLNPGYYTAKVGAIVCGGCKDLIEKTMREVPGIGAAQVDDKAGTVKFAVMSGKMVKVPELQNALVASATQMGMGADYELSDIQSLTADKAQTSPAKNSRQSGGRPSSSTDGSRHGHH